eukprot:NODE_1128_length_1454_cov_32.166541_g1117_i0.p1 GENE.NODE_1128_length_1454_cov_32.166541_g1117_i0~~NODE_1128_length_1454_cov_32.166541_g1117_i0.p1  ORF type:complete len:314 (-),score=49.58 NODE_1128_length_1454_cov_32.166541_g1117_i0:434-1375(-)
MEIDRRSSIQTDADGSVSRVASTYDSEGRKRRAPGRRHDEQDHIPVNFARKVHESKQKDQPKAAKPKASKKTTFLLPPPAPDAKRSSAPLFRQIITTWVYDQPAALQVPQLFTPGGRVDTAFKGPDGNPVLMVTGTLHPFNVALRTPAGKRVADLVQKDGGGKYWHVEVFNRKDQVVLTVRNQFHGPLVVYNSTIRTSAAAAAEVEGEPVAQFPVEMKYQWPVFRTLTDSSGKQVTRIVAQDRPRTGYCTVEAAAGVDLALAAALVFVGNCSFELMSGNSFDTATRTWRSVHHPGKYYDPATNTVSAKAAPVA